MLILFDFLYRNWQVNAFIELNSHLSGRGKLLFNEQKEQSIENVYLILKKQDNEWND